MGGLLVAGAASEMADLEAEPGVGAKAAATVAGKKQGNPEKEPPQRPIDTCRWPSWQLHTERQEHSSYTLCHSTYRRLAGRGAPRTPPARR